LQKNLTQSHKSLETVRKTPSEFAPFRGAIPNLILEQKFKFLASKIGSSFKLWDGWNFNKKYNWIKVASLHPTKIGGGDLITGWLLESKFAVNVFFETLID